MDPNGHQSGGILNESMRSFRPFGAPPSIVQPQSQSTTHPQTPGHPSRLSINGSLPTHSSFDVSSNNGGSKKRPHIMFATVEPPTRSKPSTVMRGSPFQIATEGFPSKHKVFEFSFNSPIGKKPKLAKASLAVTGNPASRSSLGMGTSASAHHSANDPLALVEDLAALPYLARRTKKVTASSRVSADTAMPGPIHSSPSLSSQAQTPSQTPEAPQNSAGESDQPSDGDSPEGEPKFVNPGTKLPNELLDEIFKSVTEKSITIIPEMLARRSMEKLPLTYCTGGALLSTTRKLREVYQVALQTRARCADFDKITLHVLNFDLSPFINHFFPSVQEENVTRMCKTPIAIKLAFDGKCLTRLPGWNGYSDNTRTTFLRKSQDLVQTPWKSCTNGSIS